jgi:hypothetical protein
MTTPDDAGLMSRVRKLLAKAEDESCTTAEAEALTAKAAELMARYGIDRALLGALHPETDKASDRVVNLENPWADVKVTLLAGLAAALRCKCVQLQRDGGVTRIHVFGYQSDLERADILFTSLLVQMHRGLARQEVPGQGPRARAWRRSYLLGFAVAAGRRVLASEEVAVAEAAGAQPAGGPGAALVLADRGRAVERQVREKYPRMRSKRVTYSGGGYQAGHADGQRADIGGARVGAGPGRALAGGR